MVDDKFRKIVDKKQKDSIPIGIDYVLTKENKPYLLEINLGPGGLRTSELGDSIVNVFIDACLNKDHQHQIFDGMMPEFTKDKSQFECFLKAKGKVVYKQIRGCQGEYVSVIEKPKWEPEILEEFILPKTVLKNGKHYPIVLRDLVYLDVKKGNLNLDIRETFRKQSKTAIEDGKSPNETFKLNTMGGFFGGDGTAERAKASIKETEVTNAFTKKAMKKLIEAGRNCSWNPTKIFQKVLISYYLGYRIPIFARKPEYISSIEKALEKQHVRVCSFPFIESLEERIFRDHPITNRFQNILFGSDAVILTGYHSFKSEFDQRIRLYLKRGRKGEIVERYCRDNGIARCFPKLENLFVAHEKSAEKLTKNIIRIYHKNREN